MTVRCISGSAPWNGQVSKSMTEYQIVYPSRRIVTGERLQMWADDAFANGDTEIEASSDQEAIDVLEDCGFITISTEDYRLSAPVRSDLEASFKVKLQWKS